MSLPVITSIADCTDVSKALLPYTSQLHDLPQQVFTNINNLQALKVIYISTNPLITAFALSLFLAPIFLIVSEANKNYSQVDRCWSILPTVYNAHYVLYAHAAGLPTKRLDTLLVFSVIWSTRLTYNYWRKGGYSIGSEDYRWEVLRGYINPPLFFIFNVTFISLAQSLLLFSITTPTYILLLAAKVTASSFPIGDLIFSRALGGLVFLAFYADEEQWKYQNAKKEYQKTAKVPKGFHQEDLDRGFNTMTIWAYSRHPNFAAEQAFWVGIYAWSCWTTQVYYNWTVIGAIAYLILFQASTWFTELLSARKYPEYKEYQRRVGKFLPRLPGGPPGDFSDKKKSNLEEKK
ncbi:hypothetical protein ACLMJK_008886 [Lecanora helva]